MSSADDILFEPLGTAKSTTPKYQHIVDAVMHALDGLQNYSFTIEQQVPLEIYNQIADVVENDHNHILYAKRVVTYDPTHIHRPANALNIRDVFARIQQGEYRFWYTGKLDGLGGKIESIKEFEFENSFSINHRLPTMKIRNQTPANTFFEWWVASLLSNFAGFRDYYAFGSLDEASKYRNLP